MASKPRVWLGHLERGPAPREGGMGAWTNWGHLLSSVGSQLGKAECLCSFWQPACVFWPSSLDSNLHGWRSGPVHLQGRPPAALPYQSHWVLLPATALPPVSAHGHRSSSSSTCSASKTFPAHEAELAPPGRSNKACGARLCSALCCFSFPFPQINRPPQRETNAFVSEAGRTVRTACLPASRQGLAESPKATGSPAMQPKSLLTVLLLRRGAFGEGWGFCPLLVPLQESHG